MSYSSHSNGTAHRIRSVHPVRQVCSTPFLLLALLQAVLLYVTVRILMAILGRDMEEFSA